MGRSSVPAPALRRLDDSANTTSLTLINRAKLDDADAWDQLVARYGPFLRYWCRSWGVDREDVDDVLQEVFQAVSHTLKHFRREREGDSFRAWLRGITRHKVLTWFRHRRERGAGGTDFYRRSLLVPAPGGPSEFDAEDAEDRDVRGAYQEALNVLRAEFEDRTWQAFWRAAVEGEATIAIAQDLGVTPAAVRQAKSRVLRRFKDILHGPLSTSIGPRPA